MTDTPSPPDLHDLARRYLDLWQEHLKAVATDRDASETLARTMALMSSGAQDLAQTFAGAAERTAADDGAGGEGAAEAGTEPGAAPAGAASGGADAGDDRIADRLAALEKRVAELESRLGDGGGSAKRGPRKSRS